MKKTVILLSILSLVSSYCTIDGDECGIYGHCKRNVEDEVNNKCECVGFWEGPLCETARPIEDLGVGYLILRVVWCVLFGLTFLLLTMQVAYRIRTNSMRSNVSNWIYILLLPWSLCRLVYHGLDFSLYHRVEDNGMFTFVLWLDLFATDILLSGFSLMIISWMEIVHRDLGSLSRNHRGCISKSVPLLVAVNLIIYGSELTAIIGTATRENGVLLRDIYFIILGVIIISFGFFLSIYGYRVLRLLSFTDAAKEETKRMSRMVIGVGISALVATFIILFFTITKYDSNAPGWAIYQIIGRLTEYTAACFLFWCLKRNSLRKSFNLRSWLKGDYHSNSTAHPANSSSFQTIEMKSSI